MKGLISIVTFSLLFASCGLSSGEDTSKALSDGTKQYIDALCNEAFPHDYDLF